jgi:hypothetical protein
VVEELDIIKEPTATVKRVSFSQFSTFSTCQHQYKLKYIDKLGKSSGNINTIFGSSVHEVLQQYLTKMFEVSKAEADRMDLDSILLSEMKKNYLIEKERLDGGENPATRIEMEEFYGDGRNIIDWFKKNLRKFYSKKRHQLLGIELPLEIDLREGLQFVGFIDVILKDVIDDKIVIVDLKTSKNGWNKYQKDDPIKRAQLLLYKKFYSDIFNVPLDKITVKYQILKRKLYEDTEFTIPRISDFVPPNGKPSINSAYQSFSHFLDTVFDTDGSYKNSSFPKTIGKHCDWCEFLKYGHCTGKL